jgi:hypothetical protein
MAGTQRNAAKEKRQRLPKNFAVIPGFDGGSFGNLSPISGPAKHFLSRIPDHEILIDSERRVC